MAGSTPAPDAQYLHTDEGVPMGKHESNETVTDNGHQGQHRADEWRGGSVGDQSGQRAGAGDRGEQLGGREAE